MWWLGRMFAVTVIAQRWWCRVSTNIPFPIVGIGSSAGGLEALRALFEHMPTDTGMAFILVSHLARDAESALPDIVGRHTKMPVVTAQDGTAIEPNTIYAVPPNAVLTVRGGKLRLVRRANDQQQKLIDIFLSSLADDVGEASVGILLSGADADGTLGIKAIKERGGLTVAQGSEGSRPLYGEMPGAAIASGLVDLVAPVEDMGPRLAEYAARFHAEESAAPRPEEDGSTALLEQYQPIYNLLLSQVGHDFSGYKERTFTRRVRRRMQVVRVQRLEDYIALLRENADEVGLLFRDLLISVTSFFRDPEAFQTLAEVVVPQLFEGKRVADTVRVWCPGCATGEEVYSLAILLREHMAGIRNPPKVQIFATDIDEPALSIARMGRYPAPFMDNVSAERRKRFFTSDEVSFTVQKEVRDMCIFSSHSVIRDPPFSRIDLISCRNVLIYLGTSFQSQVIPVFHFALRGGGYMFLGTSENVTQHGDLFNPVDKKHRIFQRRDHAVAPLQFPFFTPKGRSFSSGRDLRSDTGVNAASTNLRRAIEGRVVERFAPAHVVVNAEGDILHFSARTGKYLEPATGLPNRQLLAMARRGLRLDLRAALREAVDTRRTVVRDAIEVEHDGRTQLITLTIEPFGAEEDPLFLVLFQDSLHTVPADVPGYDVQPEVRSDRTDQLEQELRDTHERLQATIEEYETAVEELKSSNEELQSINEELQSANEELETSKEELQSVNEELQTVNAELKDKVDEVDRAHSDLRNVFESTQIATAFLDKDLNIRSFTPALTAIFNLISSDRGRPLTDIANKLEDLDFRRDIQVVLERGETIERKLRRSDSHTEYLMRVIPYLAPNHIIDGVLMTFVDVTRLAEAEARQRTLVDELNHRVRNMLMVVNAIAQQTLAQAGSPDEFAQTFSGRMQALGSSYGLISRENWEEVPLGGVIQEQLTPHQLDDRKRITISGPDVMVKPAAALALGLVTHELATNAVKYGSLSQSQGKVAIHWSIEQGSVPFLMVHWSESDGPPIKAPTRKGFGTRLIEQEVKQTLGGSAKFSFNERGFEAILSIPFDRKLLSFGQTPAS